MLCVTIYIPQILLIIYLYTNPYCVMLKRFARALGVSMDTLMDEEDEPPCADTSIQEKYDMLNPMHQEMVRESIDCYLLKEQKVAI